MKPVAKLKALRGSHHYFAVFVLVLLLIMSAIALPPDNSGRGVFMIVLAALTLFVAVWISGPTTWTPRIISGLVVFAAAASVVTWVVPSIDTEVSVSTRLILLSLVVVLPFVLATGSLRAVKEQGVTLGVVFGAVSIYLLIAVGFAVIDAIVGELDSTPFFAGSASTGFHEFPDFLYFSVITQTTVGYGDLVPATSAARALASAQALIGQLYLVSVVAVVVGNFGRGTQGARDAQAARISRLQEELARKEDGEAGTAGSGKGEVSGSEEKPSG